jgi:hypothetical protein
MSADQFSHPNGDERLVFDAAQWGAGNVIPPFERWQEDLSNQVDSFDPTTGLVVDGVGNYDFELPLEPPEVLEYEDYAPTEEDAQIVATRRAGLHRSLSTLFEGDGLMPSRRGDSPGLLQRETYVDEDGVPITHEFREVRRASDGQSMVASIVTTPAQRRDQPPEVQGLYLLSDRTAQQFRDTRQLRAIGVPDELLADMSIEHRRELVDTYDRMQHEIDTLPTRAVSADDLDRLDTMRAKLADAMIPRGLLLSAAAILSASKTYESLAIEYDELILGLVREYDMDSDTSRFLTNYEELSRLRALNDVLRRRERDARIGRVAMLVALH